MSQVSTLITSARADVRATLRDGYTTFYSLLVARDSERCARCGAAGKMQIDHIQPVTQGGPSESWNLQLLCAVCNNQKGNRMQDHRTSPVVKTLRPYQSAGLDAIDAAIARGMRRPVCAMATGLGKTLMAANFIKRRAPIGRALFLAPIDEVVFQNAKAVQAENPGIPVGIVKASLNQKNARIVIASLHTVRKSKRLQMFPKASIDTVIVDECHLNLDAYREVIDHVATPDAAVIGLSASPYRLDGRGLDEVFDDIAYEMSLIDGIREGWLCEPISLQFSLKGADFSGVHFRKGDLDQNEVAEFIRRADNWQEKITEQWRAHAGHLKTAMFVPRVEMAKELAEYLRAGGVRAAAIDGAMDKGERRKKLADYESGQLQVLVNVACLNTGWDSPSTECLLIGTLTASKSRYIQTLGRGTRLLPGVIDGLETAEERLAAIAASRKPNFLVMDLVGVTKRHKLINLASLAGKEKPLREREGLIELTADAENEKKAAVAEAEERERIEAELEAKRVSLVDWQGNGGKVALEWKQQGDSDLWATPEYGGYGFVVQHWLADGFQSRYQGVVCRGTKKIAFSIEESSLDAAKAFCQAEADKLFAKAEKPKPTPAFTWQSAINSRSTLTIRNHVITVRPMADDNWIATDGQKFRAICATEDECKRAAESFAKSLLFGEGWKAKPATDKQRATMDKLRIRYSDGITAGDASEFISAALERRKKKGKVAA